ncbi:hypothetical protein GCM10010520_55990 [Rhizobium viscosum]
MIDRYVPCSEEGACVVGEYVAMVPDLKPANYNHAEVETERKLGPYCIGCIECIGFSLRYVRDVSHVYDS